MFDRCLIPINSVAAKVTGKGVQEDVETGERTYEGCPACMKYILPNIKDLTGIRFSRFTVIGLFDDRQCGKYNLVKQQKARWVCQCSCGNYEMRRSKSINNIKNKSDRCSRCLIISQRIRKARYKETGHYNTCIC